MRRRLGPNRSFCGISRVVTLLDWLKYEVSHHSQPIEIMSNTTDVSRPTGIDVDDLSSQYTDDLSDDSDHPSAITTPTLDSTSDSSSSDSSDSSSSSSSDSSDSSSSDSSDSSSDASSTDSSSDSSSSSSDSENSDVGNLGDLGDDITESFIEDTSGKAATTGSSNDSIEQQIDAETSKWLVLMRDLWEYSELKYHKRKHKFKELHEKTLKQIREARAVVRGYERSYGHPTYDSRSESTDAREARLAMSKEAEAARESLKALKVERLKAKGELAFLTVRWPINPFKYTPYQLADHPLFNLSKYSL